MSIIFPLCRDTDFWIENAPAAVSVTQGPRQNISVPSTVAFNFSAISLSGLGTPIKEARCRLVQVSSEDASNVAARNSTVALTGQIFQQTTSGVCLLSYRFSWLMLTLPLEDIHKAVFLDRPLSKSWAWLFCIYLHVDYIDNCVMAAHFIAIILSASAGNCEQSA